MILCLKSRAGEVQKKDEVVCFLSARKNYTYKESCYFVFVFKGYKYLVATTSHQKKSHTKQTAVNQT